RILDQLQAVRLHAADLPVHDAAISAVAEIRNRAAQSAGRGRARSLALRVRKSGPRGILASLGSVPQRLLELGLQNAIEIVRRDRTDELVGNPAVAADDEVLRHAVDSPFDRGTPIEVGARGRVRIAVAAEKPTGVVGLVLVVDADDADA